MAANAITIRSAIVNKLNGVSRLNGVYSAEIDIPTDGKYPFATVIFSGDKGEFGDTIRNKRTYTFYINLYQERTSTGFGNLKAEDVMLAMCDEIETAFDMDTTLSGTVKWVRPVSMDPDYIDREIGDTRMTRLIAECVTIVPSIT
jgi:hypothetical protein